MPRQRWLGFLFVALPAALEWTQLRGVEGGEFLLITDIHLDLTYDGSLSSDCKCEARYDTSGTCGAASRQNAYGQYRCDASELLVDSALAAAAAALPNPAFVVFGGDYMRHSSTSEQETLQGVEAVTGLMAKHFPREFGATDSAGSSLVASVLGNADFFPDYELDVGNDGDAGRALAKVNPVLARVGRVWLRGGQALAAQANASFVRGGYYATSPLPGLVIACLNTVVYSVALTPGLSAAQAGDGGDPLGQWAWLEATLAGAEGAGQAVWLVGHVPPCVEAFHFAPLWHEAHAARYTALLARFGGTVKAQFFGHTHTDEFRVMTTTSSEGASEGAFAFGAGVEDAWFTGTGTPMLLVGAISPVYDSNPSFRSVAFDDETFEVTDWTVHAASLAAADGGDSAGGLMWSELYSLRRDLGMASASSAEFLALAGRLLRGALDAEPDAAEARQWRRWMTFFHADCANSLQGGASSAASGRVGDCYGPDDCDAACRRMHLCALLHGQVKQSC